MLILFISLNIHWMCISSQLVTYGPNRDDSLATMAKALDSYVIRGKELEQSKFNVIWKLSNSVV